MNCKDQIKVTRTSEAPWNWKYCNVDPLSGRLELQNSHEVAAKKFRGRIEEISPPLENAWWKYGGKMLNWCGFSVNSWYQRERARTFAIFKDIYSMTIFEKDWHIYGCYMPISCRNDIFTANIWKYIQVPNNRLGNKEKASQSCPVHWPSRGDSVYSVGRIPFWRRGGLSPSPRQSVVKSTSPNEVKAIVNPRMIYIWTYWITT